MTTQTPITQRESELILEPMEQALSELVYDMRNAASDQQSIRLSKSWLALDKLAEAMRPEMGEKQATIHATVACGAD